MKILSITAQKPHSTGSGTYMTELVRAFDRLGHEQAVVAGIYPEDEVSFPEGVDFFPVYFSEVHSPDRILAQPAGEDVHSPDIISHIKFPICGMSDVMPYASTRYCDMSGEMIAEWEREFTKSVDAAIAALDPDIILCHHLFLLTSLVKKIVDKRAGLSCGTANCGTSAGRRESERMIYGICHGTDLRQIRNASEAKRSSGQAPGDKRPLWAIDTEEIIRNVSQSDHIFALHEAQASEIEDIFGLQNSSKVSVLGSGYNGALFNTENRIERQAADPIRICYAGKVSSSKGIPELLHAFESLNKLTSESLPAFEATLIGGCNDPAVEKLLGKLPGNIKYIGQIPQAELAGIFKSNDILVLPSFFEGLPLVLIEAMASGLVPISTDLPGLRNWINANVASPNIRYIPMPEMKTIDEPTKTGRENFCNDLTAVLKATINEVAEANEKNLPDTSGITWDEVAKKILNKH